MNTPAQRFNEARAYLIGKDIVMAFAFMTFREMKPEEYQTLYDLWNSRIEPTAEHLDIIERIEAIVTKLQTT